MERIIGRILEIENDARAIVSEAEQKRDGLEDEVAAVLARRKEEYRTKAGERMRNMRKAEQKIADEAIGAIDQRHQRQMRSAQSACEAHFNEWADQIFAVVIGGGTL